MATPIPKNEARFTLAEIASATGGVLSAGEGESAIEGVAIDSRAVVPGGLFVAVRGENQDGVKYVPAAVAAGARAVLVPRGVTVQAGGVSELGSVASIEVDDTTRALGALASHHRRRWGGLVIAITGSAGKTTTKELTAAALAGTGLSVLKTSGNLNNQFGVPMMLLCAGPAHDAAVLELGTSGPGEIASLGVIAAPEVATVLLAALAHTEGLGSLAAVADEKASLWGTLGSGGIAVVNADDPELVRRVRPEQTTRSFGRAEGATVRLLDSALHVTGTGVRLAIAGLGERTVTLRLIGHAAAIDACAALVSILALRCEHPMSARASTSGSPALTRASTLGPGACADLALRAMAEVAPTPGRMAAFATAAGVTLCDDSYNANPSSMALGLETLCGLAADTGGRSIAVLADMKELGGFAQAEHARLGELAVRLGIDVLVGCGPDMAHATSAAARIAAGRLAPHPTRVAHVRDPLDAIGIAHSLCRKGDVVLVKGSRALAMERVVEALANRLGGAA